MHDDGYPPKKNHCLRMPSTIAMTLGNAVAIRPASFLLARLALLVEAVGVDRFGSVFCVSVDGHGFGSPRFGQV